MTRSETNILKYALPFSAVLTGIFSIGYASSGGYNGQAVVCGLVSLILLIKMALLRFSKNGATKVLMFSVVMLSFFMSIRPEVLHAQAQDLQVPRSGQWIGETGVEHSGLDASHMVAPILNVAACDGMIDVHISDLLPLKLFWQDQGGFYQDGFYDGAGPTGHGTILRLTFTPTNEQRLKVFATITGAGVPISFSHDIVLQSENYGPSAGTGRISVTETEELDSRNNILVCESEYTVVAENFDVNGATLLSEHIRVLDEAVGIMTPTSNGQCFGFPATTELIEISDVTGYSSGTGPESNNVQLRLSRADAVNTYLASNLTDSMHSVWQEREDGEPVNSSRADLGFSEAECNRAAVFSFKVRAEVPIESRIIGRSFSRFAATNNFRPPDPGSDAFKELLSSLIAIATEEFEDLGSEHMAERTQEQYPSDYKINVVRIMKSYRIEMSFAAKVEFWSTDISYEWGVPRNHVTVYESYDAGSDVTPTTTERSVSRSEAEQDSFLNPPSP